MDNVGIQEARPDLENFRSAFAKLILVVSLVLLPACSVKLVDLDRNLLVQKPIKMVEVNVIENKVFAENNQTAGLIGSFFGYPGYIVGHLAQYGINKSRQEGIEPLNEALGEYSLQHQFAEKVKTLNNTPVFDDNLEVRIDDSRDTSDIYPKIELRITLSKDSKILAINALMVQRANPNLKPKYQKVYLSMRKLDIPELTSDEQGRTYLNEHHQKLKEAIAMAMEDIVGLFREDFQYDIFQESTISAKEIADVPTIFGAAYGGSYRGLRVIRDEAERSILVSKGQGNLIVNVPTSWLENREKI